MKAFRFVPLFLLLSGLFHSETKATPPIHETIVQVGYFYHHLRPYGEWIEFEPGFYAWRPSITRIGWRPYMVGRWVWTDYGWYWVSHEPFGWVVFHYGRWYYDDFYDWIWIPDYVWGPAWVEWRYSDSYVGWAPLPPYARFSITVGIRFTTRWSAPVHYWNFVETRRFTDHSLDRHVEPVERTRRMFGYTRSGGRYEVSGNRIINRGVDRDLIERSINSRIERVDVRESRERGERIFRDGRTERVEVFRPDRSEAPELPERIEARRAERKPTLDLDRLERNRGENEYERSRQGRSIEGRSRSLDRAAEERNSLPESGRERKSILRKSAPRSDDQPRLESRDSEPPKREERRSILRPREEPRRFSEPPARKDGRSVQPAPSPRRDSSPGEPSRKSGGKRSGN